MSGALDRLTTDLPTYCLTDLLRYYTIVIDGEERSTERHRLKTAMELLKKHSSAPNYVSQDHFLLRALPQVRFDNRETVGLFGTFGNKKIIFHERPVM